MSLLSRLRHLRARSTRPENHLLRIEVSASALRHNLKVFQDLVGDRTLAAVLKSNAYGHGLREVGRLMEAEPSVTTMMVDSIPEVQILRSVGVKKPIVIMGYVPRARLAKLKRLGKVTLVVTSLLQARDVAAAIRFNIDVHIKVDTGMHRQGVGVDELNEAIAILGTNKRLHLTGFATHLADPDGPTPEATQGQIKQWNACVDRYRTLVSEGCFHVAATSGTAFLSEAQSTMVRLGIGLYGIDLMSGRHLDLRPALSFKAKIVNLKELAAEERLGYNFTYTAPTPRRIALLPCGYHEGVDRRLSNCGVVYLGDVPCSILGRVSMNMTTVDVTDVSRDLVLEDEVEVFSTDPTRQNSIAHVARLCDTVAHEVLTGLSPTVRRVVVASEPKNR